MVWAKSAPPVSSKILRLRSFIIGKHSRTISSSSIGPRFSGRSVPLTRTIGGRPTFRCKSLPFELDQGPEQLVDLQFLRCLPSEAVSLVRLNRFQYLDCCLWPCSDQSSARAIPCRCLTPADVRAGRSSRIVSARRTGMPRCGHHCFRLLNRILAEVKDAGRQGRVGLAQLDGVGQVLGPAGPAAGHDRDRHRVGSRRR